jgi:inorganic pyrophosphatase
MIWEFKDAKPRVINYLGYPGNYGFIPKSLLPREKGGDGDPLDIIVLGNALPRGRVAKVKLLGVLKMSDTGEQDDKLIALHSSASFYTDVDEIAGLQEKYPGMPEILRLWFENYKGPGVMEFKGFGSRKEAMEIVDFALRSYNEYKKKDKK